MAYAGKIPSSVKISEIHESRQNSVSSVQVTSRFLYVDVVNAFGVVLKESVQINELPVQVARVEIDAEAGAPIKGIKRLLRAPVVERNLTRVNFQCETHVGGLECINDGIPPVRKFTEPGVDVGGTHRGEAGNAMPMR